MKHLVAVIAVMFALLGALLASAARADFADGAQAYDGGDHETAYAMWIVLARDGDANAQVAIAGMYRFGEGRAADPAAAARWYRRAADLGAAIAQLNLGEMYMQGLGVPRDAARAHMWLTLAARQGRDWARARLDALARRMTADELDRARGLLRDPLSR